MTTKLTKSNNKIISGCCAGIAEYFGIDATLVRILYVCISIFSAGFPGVIFYLILMLLMPEK